MRMRIVILLELILLGFRSPHSLIPFAKNVIMTSIQAVETSRPNTIPLPSQQLMDRGYGISTKSSVPYVAGDSALTERTPTVGIATDLSPLSQTSSHQNYGKFNEEWDASQRGSSILDGDRAQLNHTPSVLLQGDHLLPRRGGTLKKKASLRRSGSRRSSRAGSVRSLALQPEPSDEMHSAFYSPVPTSGNPTELLANRFTGMSFVAHMLLHNPASLADHS